MLHTALIHPQLLGALAALGHGSQVLLADGNFPVQTGANPSAARVYLNVRPGLLSVDDVLEPISSVVPIESAQVMGTPDGTPVDAHAGYRALLGPAVPVEALGRFEFYDASRGPDVGLVIATGDLRLYANVLVTIGVRPPER